MLYYICSSYFTRVSEPWALGLLFIYPLCHKHRRFAGMFEQCGGLQSIFTICFSICYFFVMVIKHTCSKKTVLVVLFRDFLCNLSLQ